MSFIKDCLVKFCYPLGFVLCLCGVLLTGAVQAQFSAFDDPMQGSTAAPGANAQEFGPAKQEIEGGDIPTGQTNQVIVLLRNNTNAPITAQKIDLVPSSNVTATISADQCSKEPVKPGIECAVTVSIKAESGGKYRVGMLINHTGRSKISSIGISGNIGAAGSNSANGMPANEIDAFPKTLDFGAAKGRTPLVRSISLRNASTKTIEIQGIELAASPLTGFSVAAPECTVLEASQSCIATVTWTPGVEGKSEGVLVLRHTGPSGSLQIPITGDYTPGKTEKAGLFPSAVSGQGLIVADRDSVDFGAGVDGAASITVSLVNAGDKDVTFKQVKLAGSDNGLSLSTDGCAAGVVLSPNSGCALTVNWVARRAGPVIDDIQIIHDGSRGVLVLPVRGTAMKSADLSMPMLNSASLPKLSSGALDESLLKDVKSGGESNVSLASNAASLNGYRVTSTSADRAVIAGPRGRLVVVNGQPQMIAGGRWTPRIVSEGVELRGGSETVLLLFDASLGLMTNISESQTNFPSSSGGASFAKSSDKSDASDKKSIFERTTNPPTGTNGLGYVTPGGGGVVSP